MKKGSKESVIKKQTSSQSVNLKDSKHSTRRKDRFTWYSGDVEFKNNNDKASE